MDAFTLGRPPKNTEEIGVSLYELKSTYSDNLHEFTSNITSAHMGLSSPKLDLISLVVSKWIIRSGTCGNINVKEDNYEYWLLSSSDKIPKDSLIDKLANL